MQEPHTLHAASFFVRLSIRVLSLVLFLAVTQTQVYAAYNQGTYGSGVYNGSSTPIPTPTNSQSSSSGGQTLGASDSKPPSCSDQPPGSASDLFQIDRIGKSARLYFAPAKEPYNKYIIAYGVDDRTEQFGVQFDIGHSTGVIDYTINELEPSAAYTFKVRAGNGCATGEWSNILKAGPVTSVKLSFYRVGSSSSGDARTNTSATSYEENVVSEPSARITKAIETQKVNPQPSSPAPRPQIPTTQNQGGLWQWILNLFR
ncbi:MAG: fibronectin type III domain-containing protein [Caldilineaceae bacterium]|nr:fibronectin type III domain-containing protein [Caldilineaceae bacterium]